jgi:hypothetical protein
MAKTDFVTLTPNRGEQRDRRENQNTHPLQKVAKRAVAPIHTSPSAQHTDQTSATAREQSASKFSLEGESWDTWLMRLRGGTFADEPGGAKRVDQ